MGKKIEPSGGTFLYSRIGCTIAHNFSIKISVYVQESYPVAHRPATSKSLYPLWVAMGKCGRMSEFSGAIWAIFGAEGQLALVRGLVIRGEHEKGREAIGENPSVCNRTCTDQSQCRLRR